MAPLRLLLLASLHLLVAADSYDEPGGRSHGTLSLSHEPRDAVVARGQSARLDCLVRTPPDDDQEARASFGVAWYHDGELLHLPDQRRHLLANGSLYFDKVLHKRPGRTSSDEGVYYCVVQQQSASGEAPDSGSFVSRNATLQVAGLAREFTQWPTDVVAEVGDSVRLGCWIESVPEALVEWEKDGAPLASVGEEGFAAGARFVVLRSGALHVYRVAEEDAGNYRCVARNLLAGKERRSAGGRLTVVAASGEEREPVFVSPATAPTLWVTDKSNVTLECLVASSLGVRWTLNASLILTPNFTSGRLSVRPGFLALADVEPAMAGDYTCSASGANATVTRTTSLRVATVPLFVRAPQSQVFPTAKTVRFECEATGTPVPDIRWLKDGKPLQIGGRIKNKMSSAGSSQLVLSNTVTQDSGIYQCQAENRAGLVSAAARLLVNITGRRPEPPSRLKAVPLSASELVLSWDPPRNVPLDDVTAYTVHYTLLGRAGDETQELALNNSHHVRQLVRNANYSFYVRAYIRKSASDPSERFVFNAAQALAQPSPAPSRPPSKTLPTPPGAAAPNVTLLPLNPTTLRVTWNKFPSPVSLYKILFRRHSKKDFDIEVVKGDILEYNITGLHPGRKYDVRVAPGSLNVLGPWVTVEMPPVLSEPSTTAAPPAPSNPLAAPGVELFAANHSSVLVTWEDRGPATGRQPAESVVLTYRVQGGRDTSQRSLLPATGAQWIGDLKAGTVYEFQLVAVADGHEGPAATRTMRTLWETPAGMESEVEDGLDLEQGPVHVDANVISSSVIRLNWKPVEHGVIFYTVRFLAVADRSQQTRIGYVRSTTADVLLSNLTAHTVYQMSVRSHDRDGRLSAFSSPPVERRTLADVPGAPEDVSWLITPEDEVELTWRQPTEQNGDVVGYAILFTSDISVPIDEWSLQEEAGNKFRAQLRNLTEEVAYFVRMKARTSAGWGALTETITVQLRKQPAPATPSARSELPAGVVIGLIVALCLSLIVVVSLMLTRRCSKAHANNRPVSPTAVSIDASTPCRTTPGVGTSNGGLALSNGHPGGRSKAPDRRKNPFVLDTGAVRQASTSVEMEAFFPMLSSIPGEAPADLDTKGGNPGNSYAMQRLDGRSSSEPADVRDVTREEDEEEDEADRSQVPLLKRADVTLASHVTDTTCLSLDETPERARRRRRRRDSLHSHDSSLHSLDESSGAGRDEDDDGESVGSGSSRSLRGRDDDDTGICHADHQMQNEVVEGVASPGSSCASSASLNNNNNSINNNSSVNNNNGTSRPAVLT